jgi:hypothetical protein
MIRARSRAVLFVATGIALVSAAGAVAGASTTGNAQAIAFERAAYAVDNATAGYGLIESGDIELYSRVNPTTHHYTVSLDFGAGVVRSGWAAATADETIGQHDGKVSWISAALNVPASSPDKMVQFFVDKAGTYFFIIAKGANSTCYARWTGPTLPWTSAIGTPDFQLSGHFTSPPQAFKAAGKAYTEVSYTYPFGYFGQTATETDEFVTATKAADYSTIKVSAGKKGSAHPAFTFTQVWVPEAKPLEPKVSTCG